MSAFPPPRRQSPYAGRREPSKALIAPVDVAALRKSFGMTQRAFAWAFGLAALLP